MPSIYPGDIGGDKATSRLLLYKAAKESPVQGHAITLAGPDPENEVILLRDYLKWPGNKVWFVDKSNSLDVVKGLHRVKSLWPEANVSRSDVREIIPNLPVGFMNLDLMGFPLSEVTIECIEKLTVSLLPGSIFGLTWLKGRERPDLHKSARLLWKLGNGFQGNERRWAGLQKAVHEISGGLLRMVHRWEYHNNHSPMCVAVFCKNKG